MTIYFILSRDYKSVLVSLTSASTLGVKTSSDMEGFLGFSGGVVVELGVGCCVGITLGAVGPAIGGAGSTIG